MDDRSLVSAKKRETSATSLSLPRPVSIREPGKKRLPSRSERNYGARAEPRKNKEPTWGRVPREKKIQLVSTRIPARIGSRPNTNTIGSNVRVRDKSFSPFSPHTPLPRASLTLCHFAQREAAVSAARNLQANASFHWRSSGQALPFVRSVRLIKWLK